MAIKGIVNPDDFLYLILDTTHLSYLNKLEDSEKRSKTGLPDNILSIVPNDDGTQALVKIPFADADWRATKTWVSSRDISEGVIDVFTWSTHSELLKLLATHPNWSRTRTESEFI